MEIDSTIMVYLDKEDIEKLLQDETIRKGNFCLQPHWGLGGNYKLIEVTDGDINDT